MGIEAMNFPEFMHRYLLVWVALAIFSAVLFVIALVLSRIAKMDYGTSVALGYSVTAKNHAITIGIATIAFGGTLAVLPAAVAPIIQIPIMLLILHVSSRLKQWIS